MVRFISNVKLIKKQATIKTKKKKQNDNDIIIQQQQ
jgi:hypothetical protein